MGYVVAAYVLVLGTLAWYGARLHARRSALEAQAARHKREKGPAR